MSNQQNFGLFFWKRPSIWQFDDLKGPITGPFYAQNHQNSGYFLKKKRFRILLISNTHKHDLSTFKPKEMVMQWVELLHIDALSSVKKGPLGEKRSTFSQCHPYFNILATALSRM